MGTTRYAFDLPGAVGIDASGIVDADRRRSETATPRRGRSADRKEREI